MIRRALIFVVIILIVFGCSPTKSNQAPVAELSANPESGFAPLTVDFNANESYDPDGSISAYRWDFEGDGTIDAEGIQLRHTFTNIGTYNTTLEVEDNQSATGTTSFEILVSDGSPLLSWSNFTGDEDTPFVVDLNGKVSSQLYSFDQITISYSSPDLEITRNGSELSIINSVDGWSGSSYIDFTITDPDSRTTNKRVNGIWNPQTDISGYLEHNLTGNPVTGFEVNYSDKSTSTDSNGSFSLQVPTSNRNLELLSSQFYNIRIPQAPDGQDIDLGLIQMMERFTDSVNGVDGLEYLRYMVGQEGPNGKILRWMDKDLPLPVNLNEALAPEGYVENIIAHLNLWEEKTELDLFNVFSNSLPDTIGIEFFYPNPFQYRGYTTRSFYPEGQFDYQYPYHTKIEIHGGFGAENLRGTPGHELGHTLGIGIHSDFSNYIMHVPSALEVSDFEALCMGNFFTFKNKTPIGQYSKN